MFSEIIRPGGLHLTKIGAQIAELNETSIILDVGCGAGTTLHYLQHQYGLCAYGIDLSETAVNLAKKRAPNANIQQADALSMPFDNEFFDVVFFECSLCLTTAPRIALKEAFRTLKPGGWLIITTLCDTNNENTSHDNMLCPEAIIDMLQSLGLTQIKAENHSDQLVQFLVDAVFQSGSIDNYLQRATALLGADVCTRQTANLSYYLFASRKKETT